MESNSRTAQILTGPGGGRRYILDLRRRGGAGTQRPDRVALAGGSGGFQKGVGKALTVFGEPALVEGIRGVICSPVGLVFHRSGSFWWMWRVKKRRILRGKTQVEGIILGMSKGYLWFEGGLNGSHSKNIVLNLPA